MISLTEFILRLRAQCPIFGNRVGGTAEYGAVFANATADLPVPHCFIVPMDEVDVSGFIPNNTDIQEIRDYFATIIAVDNSLNAGKSGGGLARLEPFDQIALIKENIMAAFGGGWRPKQRFDLVRFARGASLGLDNKRLWHSFEWYVTQEAHDPEADPSIQDQVDAIINDMDVVHPVAGGGGVMDTLRKIYVTYHLTPFDSPHPSEDDYFLPPAGNYGIPAASPEEIAEKQAGAQVQMDVPGLPGPYEPTDADKKAAASHAPAPLYPLSFHGISVVYVAKGTESVFVNVFQTGEFGIFIGGSLSVLSGTFNVDPANPMIGGDITISGACYIE